MKVSKTKNRFKIGFQQPKSGLQKTSINIYSSFNAFKMSAY